MTTILIAHLGPGHIPEVRDCIVRALGAASSDDRDRADAALRQVLSTEPEVTVRDAIVVSLGRLAGPEDLERLVRDLHDGSLGDSRILLLPAIRRYGEPGRAILEAATTDPVLRPEALHQLSIGRSSDARRRMEALSVPDETELVSVALDREALAPYLEDVSVALGISAEAMRSVATEAVALDVDEELSSWLEMGTGTRIRLGAWIDDTDAVDVAIFGPNQLAMTLERVSARHAKDLSGQN